MGNYNWKIAKKKAVEMTSHRLGLDREVATKHAIAVVKEVGLKLETRGDLDLLKRTLGSSMLYAKHVLQAFSNGT